MERKVVVKSRRFRFDRSVRRFKCKNWDDSPSSDARTPRKLPK